MRLRSIHTHRLSTTTQSAFNEKLVSKTVFGSQLCWFVGSSPGPARKHQRHSRRRTKLGTKQYRPSYRKSDVGDEFLRDRTKAMATSTLLPGEVRQTTTHFRSGRTGVTRAASRRDLLTPTPSRLTMPTTIRLMFRLVDHSEAFNYAASDFDQTHIFTINYIYDIPSASRHMNDNKFVGAILDNWQISGTTSYATGKPKNLTASYSSTAATISLGQPCPGWLKYLFVNGNYAGVHADY